MWKVVKRVRIKNQFYSEGFEKNLYVECKTLLIIGEITSNNDMIERETGIKGDYAPIRNVT